MNIGMDPYALTVAVIALVVSWIEVRRNRAVKLTLLKVEGSGSKISISENNRQAFSEFRILIANRGRTLHDVHLHLSFREYEGAGMMHIPIARREPFDDHHKIESKGEFSYGMVGNFGLKSYELHPAEVQMLQSLKDAVKQEATISVSSQGYQSKSFSVGGLVDRIKRRWNEMASRINPMFNTNVSRQRGKKKFLKWGSVVPTLPTLWLPLSQFVQSIASIKVPPRPPLRDDE